jgi:large subunit ribosomal protein L15
MVDHVIHLNQFVGSCSKKRKRVGRGIGSGRGGTSGAGDKGQCCRPGSSVRGRHADIVRKFPKFGFKSKKVKPISISILSLIRKVKSLKETSGVIDVKKLFKFEDTKVKLVGKSSIDFPLKIKVDKISAGCRESIVASGGEVQI